MKHIEILAPAGSYEGFLAALHAGSDAVYLGGTMFSARASAENFSKEQLLKAIDYAHFHGRKVYMTVNTLLKEKEIKQLPEYILPYYKQGLDAVIVQDMGVLKLMAEFFPSMAIHLSTQLTLTGSMGAKLFRVMSYPVTRLVPARELSLNEYKILGKETDLELEVFVHGALCVSYSGQCFLSSMIGGRSGNRGRCAQPCRKQYKCKKNMSYLLSPKDLCALEMIPELIEAGVDSFKIEGRMKKPEYAAYLSWLYRKYTDRFLQYGKEEYHMYFRRFPQELQDDLRNVKDLYNRGGFTKGYFMNYNGMDMMSVERPNHTGVLVGTVKEVKEKRAEIFWKQEINPQDIIEIRSYGKSIYEYTSGQMQKKGTSSRVKFLQTAEVKPGMEVFRTRNNCLLLWIDENLKKHSLKKKLYGKFYACPGKEASLIVWSMESLETKKALQKQEIVITVTGDICQEAQKQPLDEAFVYKQLSKLGDTEFIWQELQIQLEGKVFLSIKSLNELRRQALLEFQKNYLEKFSREEEKGLYKFQSIDVQEMQKNNIKPKIAVEVLTIPQWKAALSFECVYIIYARMEILEKKEMLDLAKETIKQGKKCFLSMPAILRQIDRKEIKEVIEDLLLKQLCSGILLHNLEELGFLKQLQDTSEIKGLKEIELIADFSMYSTNSQAIEFWKESGCCRVTASIEQNFKEIKKLFSLEKGIETEILCYGRLPLMVSAQCIVSHGNDRDCNRAMGSLLLKDEWKETIYVRNFCKFCYNILYSGKIYDLRQYIQELLQAPFHVWRCSFIDETEKEVVAILNSINMMLHGTNVSVLEHAWTGHFHRGMI